MASSGDPKETETVNFYEDLTLLTRKRIKLSTASPFIPAYVQSHLSQSADPGGLYASRIQGRQILLENPAKESRARKERLEKQQKKTEEKTRKKLGVMGRTEAKARGIWTLKKEQTKFNLFLPLHYLWMGYMSELLELPSPLDMTAVPSPQQMPNSAAMHTKLVKADFHGAIMTVRQSKNPCLVGLSGIVIHESENVFKVVTKKNELKAIPKKNSIFAFAVPFYSTLLSADAAFNPVEDAVERRTTSTVLDRIHIEFDLHGSQFCFRSAERAGRKFKHKETIEL